MFEKTMDAVSIGACNLDLIAFVSKFPEAEEKINAIESVPPKAAGVAMDAVTQMAYLGLRCGHIGKMGDDQYSEIVKRELGGDNIDLSQSITVPGERTSSAWVMVNPNSGERCHIIHAMGPKGMLTEEEISQRAEYIRSAKVCHMEMLQMPIAPMIRAAEISRPANTVVSFDLDIAPRYLYEYGYSTPEQLKKMFSLTDVLKACKNAVPDLTDKTDLEEAARDILKMGPKVVIITTGEKGCVVAYTDENGEVKSASVPAFTQIQIKDTTGAGDSFQGGFIYGYVKGWPVEKCAVLANACGALKSGRIGARNMTPYKEVEAFMKQNGWTGLE